METNELRIGNLVELNKQFYTVSLISHKTIQIISQVGFGYVTTIENINPIPITDKLLEECSIDNEVVISFDVSKDLWFITRNSNILIKCEYVHQLQNLFFAVIGKEMAIKNPPI